MSSLLLTPITSAEANAFIDAHHRHNKPSIGSVFNLSVAEMDQGYICGVAMVGRPVARGNDDNWTLEVTRLATDGTKNACSFTNPKRVPQICAADTTALSH